MCDWYKLKRMYVIIYNTQMYINNFIMIINMADEKSILYENKT